MPPAARSDYRWYPGFNIALATLRNVETDLWRFTHPVLVSPKTQPVNLFPVRTLLANGKERGDGFINHEWLLSALPIAAFDYILTTYYANGAVVSNNITIYTRRHNRLTYARYNAYAITPSEGEDYEYDRGHVINLRLRFRALVAL